MSITKIEPEFLMSFPAKLEPGILYVSAPFATSAHLCACGCGRDVVTPLSPAQWILTFDGSVSLRPSIGNWSLPCQSHYLIDQGTIRWMRVFTRDEIQRNRESDGQALTDSRTAGRPARLSRLLRRFYRLSR